LFGAHVYNLRHNVNTRNWIAFPTNFTYLTNALDILDEIVNVTTFTLWNETLQRRVTCNEFSCPDLISCTPSSCNFNIEGGRGYEINVNNSGPNQINWSGVGFVHADYNLT